MNRIRTIKPDFFTDEKILRLSDHTALFFISLWCAADDYGYFPLASLELSKRTGRWRSQDIQKYLKCLHEAGLVGCSRGDGVGFIKGWRHQRVGKPYPSKWKDKQIQWDTEVNSGKVSLYKESISKVEVDDGRKNFSGKEDEKAAAVFNQIEKQETNTQQRKLHILGDIWNKYKGNLPPCQSTNLVTEKCIARWKEKPDKEYWTKVIKKIAASDFCNNKTKKRFRARFEFLICPGVHQKAIEGVYDNEENVNVKAADIPLIDRPFESLETTEEHLEWSRLQRERNEEYARNEEAKWKLEHEQQQLKKQMEK